MSAIAEVIPAVVEPAQHLVAANPLDISPEAFRGALARRGANRKALMDWVRASLVEDIDYGKIHVVGWKKCQLGNDCKNPAHYSKDCLFKPGSEKIAGMLGVTPTFPTLQKYEEAALAGVELKQIILRCHMVDASGRIVADGIGARSLAQDYDDLNKALKMCAKSAMIDATLRMAGLSEVFTQEYEDEPEQPPGENKERVTISEEQIKNIRKLLKELGKEEQKFLKWAKVDSIDQIVVGAYDETVKTLEAMRK